MRIKSGTTDQYAYFKAVDATDLVTPETSLTTPTVYRSRNGAAAAAMTTPTIAAVDATNMPGVFSLLLDEDMTIAAGNDTELMTFHIDATEMAPVTLVIELFRTNVDAISGDSGAADNLELMYDGTGYTDDTAPASRSQVGALSIGSASISTTSESATITTGVETGTYTNTTQLDGTLHQVEDAAGTTDFYYQFDVGGDGVPTEFVWDGYAQANGDTWRVYAYNWGGTSWDQIGEIPGANGTTMIEKLFIATTAHVGTGANLGKVRLRFESTDGTNIFTDRILCSYAVVARSVGYALGAIWVDTNGSNTNTESYVDGTADNPVSTWAAALTLSSQLGIKHFELTDGSSITLTANSDNYTIRGYGATIALGGQSCAGAVIHGATVSGTCTGATPWFRECSIGTVTLPPSNLDRCGFTGTMTVGSVGDFYAIDCFSQVAGASAPTFDMVALVGATNISIRRWGGGLTISNIAAGDVVSAEATAGGALTLSGAAGTVEARGGWKVVSSGSFSGTLTDRATNTLLDTIDTVVDAILADTGTDGVVISAATANQIADHLLRRTWANAEASSDGDTIAFRSLLGAVAKLVNKVAISGTDLEIYRDDDTTVLGTQALTTDAAADPITAMDTT